MTFVIDQGRCTFTLPSLVKDIEPLRAFLEAGKATNLELRRGDAADVAKNRAREAAALVKSSGKPLKITLKQHGKPISRAPFSVSVMLDYKDGIQPPTDLVVDGDEVLGFGKHPKGPQLNIISGLKQRSLANLTYPTSALLGLSVGPDGLFRMGGGAKTAIYVSSDRGRSWQEEPTPGLGKLMGDNPIVSTCWFDGELWVAGEGGIARRTNKAWTSISLPAKITMSEYEPVKLIVSGGVLYFLAVGLARWDGRKLVPELTSDRLPVRMKGSIPPAALISLATTRSGTVLLGGSRVWRRAPGKTWTELSKAKLGIDPEEPAEDATYEALIVIDDTVVLVGNTDRPEDQLHMVRVSEDDGASFRVLAVPDGRFVFSSAIADPEGGVLIAGFGGALLRVTC